MAKRVVPDTHEVVCPSCAAPLEIDLDDTRRGSLLHDPDRTWRCEVQTGVRPPSSAALAQPASRLHRLATEAPGSTRPPSI
ncbi:hypothetical protein ACFYYN_14470 [Streptomyces sp. NPDC001902]